LDIPSYFPLLLPVLYLCPLSNPNDFTLKKEAGSSSETMLSYHFTTTCHNPDDHDMKLRRRAKLKFSRRKIVCPYSYFELYASLIDSTDVCLTRILPDQNYLLWL